MIIYSILYTRIDHASGIGQVTDIEPIGTGQRAEIFAASRNSDGERVALKVFKASHLAAHAAHIEMVRAEVEAARRVLASLATRWPRRTNVPSSSAWIASTW